jgi:NADH:quinone reductase (non-electrogenic)
VDDVASRVSLKTAGLRAKLKVFFEWTLELLFSRDISLLDIKTSEVVGRVHLEKGDPVYHIGDPAFSFYVIVKGSVEISDENGSVRRLGRGHHFGERELLRNLKRQFNATALDSTILLTLDRATFDALAEVLKIERLLCQRDGSNPRGQESPAARRQGFLGIYTLP